MSTDTLYTPYKVVGLVSDAAPFVVNEMGSETFLTVAIGQMFQVFRADRLTPVLVSKAAPGNIDLLQVYLFLYHLTVLTFSPGAKQRYFCRCEELHLSIFSDEIGGSCEHSRRTNYAVAANGRLSHQL